MNRHLNCQLSLESLENRSLLAAAMEVVSTYSKQVDDSIQGINSGVTSIDESIVMGLDKLARDQSFRVSSGSTLRVVGIQHGAGEYQLFADIAIAAATATNEFEHVSTGEARTSLVTFTATGSGLGYFEIDAIAATTGATFYSCCKEYVSCLMNNNYKLHSF